MHELPSGSIPPPGRREDRSSTADRPRKGRSRRAHAAVPDLSPGDEYGGWVRTRRPDLAPRSMLWEGKSKEQICEQMKDPARNAGRRTGEEVIEHTKTDPLVLWAWA